MKGKKAGFTVISRASFLSSLGLFFGLLFLLVVVGIVPATDGEGNPVELGSFMIALLSVLSFFSFIVASIGIVGLVGYRNRLEMYQNGMLFPIRTIVQIMSKEDRFLSFNDMEEVFLNEPPITHPFVARTRKGYVDARKKEKYRQIAEKLRGRLPYLTVLQRNGEMRWIIKEEIDDLDEFKRKLDGRVEMNNREYFFMW